MKDYFDSSDSIIALSSGSLGKSAISVIRISGPIEPGILVKYLSINGPIEPRRAYFSKLYDESNKLLDEVVLTYFAAPSSYTGENVYELSVHGNPLNIKRIIRFLIDKLDLRDAAKGEFSYRALRNKKLSLNQIEGLDLVLNSDSGFAIDSGLELLSGNIDTDYDSLRKSYLKLVSLLEVVINFSDDIGEKESLDLFKVEFYNFKNYAHLLKGRSSVDGDSLIKPKVVLYGKPNSGKSTFFNRILKRDRAIVSEIEGTTRDYISENLYINDINFEIIDTAGIRETDNLIESKGIDFSNNLLKRSFYRVCLCKEVPSDISVFDLVIKSHSSYGSIEPINNGPIGPNPSGPIGPSPSGPIGPSPSGPIGPNPSGPIGPNPSGPIGPNPSGPIGPSPSGPIGPKFNEVIFNSESSRFIVEADLTDINDDFDEFIKRLIFFKFEQSILNSPIVVPRHRNVISKLNLLIDDFSNLLELEKDFGIISSEISNMGALIEELIGQVRVDDVLDNIFANFCIGK